MAIQITTCRYRGDKIVTTYFGGLKMTVFVYDERGINYYRTTCNNLQDAMAYATNAVHYHRDGVADWPAGLPHVSKRVLPHTKARHERRGKRMAARVAATRRDVRRGWLDKKITDYLDVKMEDY